MKFSDSQFPDYRLAQTGLRQMAFRQIHETLMMEALPTPRFKRGVSAGASNRKRRRDESGNEVDADGSEGIYVLMFTNVLILSQEVSRDQMTEAQNKQQK